MTITIQVPDGTKEVYVAARSGVNQVDETIYQIEDGEAVPVDEWRE